MFFWQPSLGLWAWDASVRKGQGPGSDRRRGGFPLGGDDVFRENRLWTGVVVEYPLAEGGLWRVDRLESIDVKRGIGR